ncbi:tetratricopeptide repeat protein [Neolewinella aurantiaca]|uniref:Tetratricopeptide repeat protein n=1 Tax=Neolewinella aurantiaca TaxID=2602767 RepID=A0A5C7FHA0_9BACT|nr:tetratricopeptide repeat protein [Neolewinella aurantiaca]TXF85664.1 tetratricopeptide repeat protein [Neolewinella aurantiaca]
MNKLYRFLFILLAFQIAVSSCASTKKRDDQSALGKLWHNMNSHYNGYFNAKEIMTETLLSIDEQHVDNYTQRLDMFPFLELDNTSSVTEQLDIAIEKVAIVVKKHPYSNWVDDSYLLIGQAQLIKQDYESAEKTLRFMVTEFRPRPTRKKSKKASGESDEPEEEFVSRRNVESNPAQDIKDRLRARKDAQKERKKLSKERQKAAKERKKQREKERKARIRARKKGIKLAPVSSKTDTSAVTGLENEPEEDPEEELGPIGMISIFNQASNLGGGEAYGKKSGSYMLKHRPAFQEGRLWLAWTLVKRDNFDQAQIILEDMRANRGTFPDIRRKAMAVQAFLYLEQGKFEEAIPYLEEAAEVAESRNERARYYYIAGQLYQELGQPSGAAGAFEKTIAARPDYELELGARLNLAQNSFLSGTGSAADALKKLERMAKEDKNIPYESQIYFSMAAVALKSGDQEAGAQYLQMSLSSPSAGSVQRTEAYSLLGDLAYNEDDFLSAKLYYDTTLTVMDKGDFRYDAIEGRRDQLTGIADALTDIEVKDSLLRIGMLPEPEREKWAANLFEQRRQASIRPTTPIASNSRGSAGGSALSTSSFWAYSSQAIKRGKRDFERTWGERPLTDNWRRSRRTGDIFEDDGDGGSSSPTEEVTIVTEDEITKLLEGIPTTEAEQNTMTIQQATNWFNLGREYRDQLDNSPKALSAFETLNNRYPNANGEAESWYYQYLIHKENGNTAKAQEFATKLKSRYNGSKYEKLSNDPSYAATLMADENKLVREYETAYRAFEQGDYNTAHEMAVKGRATLLGKHPLKARYALLLAMTTGNTQGRQAYINALRQVVSQFDNTPEQTRAKEILRLLGESGARLPGQTSASAASGGFKESMDELHYLLIVFNDEDTDLNAAKIKVAEFNNKYNKMDRLRVTNVYLGTGNKTPVLVIRRIKSGELAMKYVNNAIEREKEFLNAGVFDYDVYAVSQSNYREVLKARSVESYREWFKENY